MADLRRLADSRRLLRLVDRGEKFIAILLAVLLLAVTAVGSVQLLMVTLRQLIAPGVPWFGNRLNELLGDLLILLIALEVLQNITAYLRRGIVQIQLVLLTAITAVARKVIVLPPGSEDKPQLLISLGFTALFLTAAWWLVNQSLLRQQEAKTASTRSSLAPDPLPPADAVDAERSAGHHHD